LGTRSAIRRRDPLLPERSLNDLVVTISWGDHLEVCFGEELRRL